MDIWVLLSVFIFQPLNFTLAEWDPKRALILIELTAPNTKKMFPFVVRMSQNYECKVYYHENYGDDVITYSYCPNPDAENKYCNYAKSLTTTDLEREHLRERCPIPLDYDIISVTNSEGQRENCDKNKRDGYHRYKIVYLLCKPNRNEREEIQVYEVCYKDVEKQISFGSYTIYSPWLLENDLLADEQSYSFKFDNSEREEFFQEIQAISYILYKQSHEYVPRSVLPHELLPFGLQRKTFFNYMIVAPMHKDLKEGWEVLMMNLKLRINQMREAINVTAGVLDTIVADRNTRIKYMEVDQGLHGHLLKKYLGRINNNWEIEIPKTFWVLIYNENNTTGVVVMMHNECYFEKKGKPNMLHYDGRICGPKFCGLANLNQSLPNRDEYPKNFIYCCYPSFITTKFGLPGTKGLLRFPSHEP